MADTQDTDELRPFERELLESPIEGLKMEVEYAAAYESFAKWIGGLGATGVFVIAFRAIDSPKEIAPVFICYAVLLVFVGGVHWCILELRESANKIQDVLRAQLAACMKDPKSYRKEAAKLGPSKHFQSVVVGKFVDAENAKIAHAANIKMFLVARSAKTATFVSAVVLLLEGFLVYQLLTKQGDVAQLFVAIRDIVI